MSLSLKVIGVLILLSLCSVSAYVMGYEDMPLVEAAVRSRGTPTTFTLEDVLRLVQQTQQRHLRSI